MVNKVKCIGGVLDGIDVDCHGGWFSIDDDKNRHYSSSQLGKDDFAEKYVLSDVYLTENTNNFTRLFLWEADGRNLKKHLNS